MKLFIFVFALVLLQALAMPINDDSNGDDEAAVREVAIKATKFKKALTEFHDVLVQHPQILDGLSEATQRAPKTKKSAGSPQNKKLNKKIFGIFESIIKGIGGILG